jgi:hypothetical protein
LLVNKSAWVVDSAVDSLGRLQLLPSKDLLLDAIATPSHPPAPGLVTPSPTAQQRTCHRPDIHQHGAQGPLEYYNLGIFMNPNLRAGKQMLRKCGRLDYWSTVFYFPLGRIRYSFSLTLALAVSLALANELWVKRHHTSQEALKV